MNSDSAFFLLYDFCLLKHFYTPSFYLSAFTERGIAGHRGRPSFLFYLNVDQGWPPSVQTVWRWLSCISCHKYQMELHSSDNSHNHVYRLRSVLPLFRALSLFTPIKTNSSVGSFSVNSDFCLTSSHTLVLHLLWHPVLLLFLFLIIKKTSSDFRNPAYTYLLLRTSFFSPSRWKAFH